MICLNLLLGLFAGYGEASNEHVQMDQPEVYYHPGIRHQRRHHVLLDRLPLALTNRRNGLSVRSACLDSVQPLQCFKLLK